MFETKINNINKIYSPYGLSINFKLSNLDSYQVTASEKLLFIIETIGSEQFKWLLVQENTKEDSIKLIKDCISELKKIKSYKFKDLNKIKKFEERYQTIMEGQNNLNLKNVVLDWNNKVKKIISEEVAKPEYANSPATLRSMNVALNIIKNIENEIQMVTDESSDFAKYSALNACKALYNCLDYLYKNNGQAEGEKGAFRKNCDIVLSYVKQWAENKIDANQDYSTYFPIITLEDFVNGTTKIEYQVNKKISKNEFESLVQKHQKIAQVFLNFINRDLYLNAFDIILEAAERLNNDFEKPRETLNEIQELEDKIKQKEKKIKDYKAQVRLGKIAENDPKVYAECQTLLAQINVDKKTLNNIMKINKADIQMYKNIIEVTTLVNTIIAELKTIKNREIFPKLISKIDVGIFNKIKLGYDLSSKDIDTLKEVHNYVQEMIENYVNNHDKDRYSLDEIDIKEDKYDLEEDKTNVYENENISILDIDVGDEDEDVEITNEENENTEEEKISLKDLFDEN